MKELIVTHNNIHQLSKELHDSLDKNGQVLVTISQADTGKWGMARLWRAWMAVISEYMASNGVTMPLLIDKDGQFKGTREFNAEDAHELFTRSYLKEINGVRLSWSKKGTDGRRAATKGERFHALRQVESFARERGITLPNPKNSEYSKLSEDQDR